MSAYVAGVPIDRCVGDLMDRFGSDGVEVGARRA